MVRTANREEGSMMRMTKVPARGGCGGRLRARGRA
jgi:hypothetical protein